jgi:hypothetical protein
MSNRFIAILEGLDETGNAFLGPVSNIPQACNPHYTLSQRWGYMIRDGNLKQRAICKSIDFVLTIIEKYIVGIWLPICRKTNSHCLDAIKDFPDNLPYSG